MKSKYVKNFIFNMIGSTVNASISLFLLIFVTRINGISNAGVFSFSFSIACVFQVIATYAGRTYQVTERNKNITDCDFVYHKIVSCILMICATIIFMSVKNYDFEKNVILLLLTIYKLLESFVDVFYGIMQKNDDLYKVGISLFLKGIFGVILFFVCDILTKNLILSVLLLIIVNVLLIIIYDIKNVKKYNFKLSFINKDNIVKIFKCGLCTFLLTLLTQYIINASKCSIDTYLTDDFQTIFGIIVMPATVIILCGQLIIHPFLMKITNYLKEENIKKFNGTIFRLSLATLLFGVFANVVAFFIGIPFLELIYGLNLKQYLTDLILIISGATLFGVTYIISNALITLRDTFSQVIIFIISSIFSYIISNELVSNIGIHGATYSYLISMSFLTILFVVYYIVKILILNRNNESNKII